MKHLVGAGLYILFVGSFLRIFLPNVYAGIARFGLDGPAMMQLAVLVAIVAFSWWLLRREYRLYRRARQ